MILEPSSAKTFQVLFNLIITFVIVGLTPTHAHIRKVSVLCFMTIYDVLGT